MDSASRFRDAIKTLINGNRFGVVARLLPQLLKEHPRHNDALELSRQIRKHLDLKNALTRTTEQIDADEADLSVRLMRFVDSLEFDADWPFDWDLINSHVQLAEEADAEFRQLARSERYTCNRYESVNAFLERFNGNPDKKQFYFILGEERESPYGLYQRLGLHEIPDYVNPTQEPLPPIPLRPESRKPAFDRVRLLRDLFSHLQLDVNQLDLEKASFPQLKESPIVSEEEAIVVGFKKKLEDWTPGSAALIEWFVKKFCQSDWYASDPTFIFIFKIVYPSPENGRHDRRTRRLIRKCRKELYKIGNLTFLEDLRRVSRSDVSSWLEEHLERDYAERQEIIEAKFGKDKDFHMYRVERALDRIIQEHNRKKYN